MNIIDQLEQAQLKQEPEPEQAQEPIELCEDDIAFGAF